MNVFRCLYPLRSCFLHAATARVNQGEKDIQGHPASLGAHFLPFLTQGGKMLTREQQTPLFLQIGHFPPVWPTLGASPGGVHSLRVQKEGMCCQNNKQARDRCQVRLYRDRQSR